ncbi:MAG: type II secretion system protein [Myxococcota bacterium]
MNYEFLNSLIKKVFRSQKLSHNSSFIIHNYHTSFIIHHSRSGGFSLPEIMVALVILSTSLFVLLRWHTQSIQLASRARDVIVATNLARGKVLDCRHLLRERNLDASARFDEEGNFAEEGHESFTWECHAYPLKLPVAGAAAAVSQLAGEADETGQAGIAASVAGPWIDMIAQALSDAIRELVVIVRWPRGKKWEEMRMVAHVIDKTPLLPLLQSLQRGGQLFPGMGAAGNQEQRPDTSSGGAGAGQSGSSSRGGGATRRRAGDTQL